MNYQTARATIIRELGGSYTNNSVWHQGLKTYKFDVFTGRMNNAQKARLNEILLNADVDVINWSGRITIIERLPQTYKKGMGKYHPTNRDRDQVQYASPSLVRLIAHNGDQGYFNRVVVLGGNFPGTDKHVTIDISWDPVVIGDWNVWCLEAALPSYTDWGQVETIVEFLVDASQHPNWKGYEQVQGNSKG